jgi:hypothetical protein
MPSRSVAATHQPFEDARRVRLGDTAALHLQHVGVIELRAPERSVRVKYGILTNFAVTLVRTGRRLLRYPKLTDGPAAIGGDSRRGLRRNFGEHLRLERRGLRTRKKFFGPNFRNAGMSGIGEPRSGPIVSEYFFHLDIPVRVDARRAVCARRWRRLIANLNRSGLPGGKRRVAPWLNRERWRPAATSEQ